MTLIVRKTEVHRKPNLDTMDIYALLLRLGVRIKIHDGEWITCWCEFHDDGENPNLRVRSDTGGTFRCFSCGATGNIWHIIEKKLAVSREEAWAWVEHQGAFGATTESILRALQKRHEAEVNDLRDRAEAHLTRLWLLVSPSPTIRWLQDRAAREGDADRFFALEDPDRSLLENMVEYLYIYRYCDPLGDLWNVTDEAVYAQLLVAVAEIWEVARRTGYLARHPVEYVLVPRQRIGWMAQDGTRFPDANPKSNVGYRACIEHTRRLVGPNDLGWIMPITDPPKRWRADRRIPPAELPVA